MVDLVKIRQKAKEKKEPEDTAEVTPKAEAPKSEEPSTEKTPGRKVPSRKEKEVDAAEKQAREPASSEVPPAKEPARKAEKSPASVQPKKSSGAKEAKAAPAKQGTAVVEPEKTDATRAEPSDEAPAPDEEILDRLERFKREAGKRREWVAPAATTAGTTVEEEVSLDLELLRFRLAGEEYAVDIEKIVEIVPPRATTRVPNAEHSIVGIMSLRGTIVTVFDLRRKLGHPALRDGQDADRRMIVVERDGETAGFLVDKVSRVVKLDPGELENHPVVSAAEQSDYVGGVFQSSDGLVILLDLEKILASQS